MDSAVPPAYHGSDSELSVSPEFSSLSCGKFPCCSFFNPPSMHPSISLETLKLRRMNLLQYSFCYLTETPDVPGLFDAIGLDAAEELVAMREEDIFITAGRDLDTTLSPPFCSGILFAIVMQLIKLKYLVQRRELKCSI